MDLMMLLGPTAGDSAAPTRRGDGKQAAGAAGALFHGLLAGATTRDERQPAETVGAITPLALGGGDAEAPSDAQDPELVSATAQASVEDADETETGAIGDEAKILAGGGDVPLATLSPTATSAPLSPQFTLTPLPDPLSESPLTLPTLQGPPLGPSLSAPSALPSLGPAGDAALLASAAKPGSPASEGARVEATLAQPGEQPAAVGTAPGASADMARATDGSGAPPASLPELPAGASKARAVAAAVQPDRLQAQRAGQAQPGAATATPATAGSEAANLAAPTRNDAALRRSVRQTAGRTSVAAPRGDARAKAAPTGPALPGVALTASESPQTSAQSPGEAQPEPARAAGDGAARPAPTTAPSAAREAQTPAMALAGEAPVSASSEGLDAAPAPAESAPLPVRELPERTLRVLSELRGDGETHYRAELQLDPPALGPLRLEVELDGEGRRSLTRFTVETPAAHEQLQAELPRLRALLAEQGLGDARVELQLRQGGHQGQPRGEGQSRSWREGLRAEREASASTSTWRSGHDGLIDLRA
ncbi:hypothetical protein FJ251_04605 [bacterium]|nr:hypothetical protein [bacterium]